MKKKSHYLIVGLGNPGTSYEKTRHNAGFMVADSISQKLNGVFKRVHLHYSLACVKWNNQQILLLKPMTYMNLSGIAVENAMKTYQIQSSQVLIVYDDIHLPVGRIRIRKHGSDGGQKGLKSILQLLGSKRIARLRVGVGSPSESDVIDHVLSPFSDLEIPIINKSIQNAQKAALDTVEHGIEYTMNIYNGLNCE